MATLRGNHFLTYDLDTLTNEPLATDVNADGDLTPRDALAVINFLAITGLGEEPEGYGPLMFYDVNADAKISPRDALYVINALARSPEAEAEAEAEPEPEPEPEVASDFLAVDPVTPSLDVAYHAFDEVFAGEITSPSDATDRQTSDRSLAQTTGDSTAFRNLEVSVANANLQAGIPNDSVFAEPVSSPNNRPACSE